MASHRYIRLTKAIFLVLALGLTILISAAIAAVKMFAHNGASAAANADLSNLDLLAICSYIVFGTIFLVGAAVSGDVLWPLRKRLWEKGLLACTFGSFWFFKTADEPLVWSGTALPHHPRNTK